MINISTLFDPRYVFLIYAPILFAINKRVGHRTIIALTLTEWANQILKWLLAGERPYWYVHERANELLSANNATTATTGIESYDTAAAILLNNNPPTPVAQLKQFPVTCELGAGSPSGHAMVTATVWYILIDAYLKGELPLFKKVNYSNLIEQQQQQPNVIMNKMAKLTWSIYTLILISVSLSRVYLACHFPHQCICGAILGVVVARLVAEKLPMEELHKHHFAITTAFMFASALGTYGFLRSLGMNPLWSVDKGMRWCIKKEYIHLDTTPFFSMTRYLGFCLGAGLAYESGKIRDSLTTKTADNTSPSSSNTSYLLLFRVVTTLASVLFGQFLLSLPIPNSNLNLFYVISFIMYTVFSYAIAGPIPRLIKTTLGGASTSNTTRKVKAQ